VGGLKRVAAHDGSLDLVCTQERISQDLQDHRADEGVRDTRTVDEVITARKSEK